MDSGLGYSYACVAMCGIVGERLVKDALRASVFVEKDGQVQRPNELAFDQFERIEVNGIVLFLKGAKLLGSEACKTAVQLGKLRTAYVHAPGIQPKRDALKAIQLLHTPVEDTVSMFRNFEIKDGVFVRKPAAQKWNDASSYRRPSWSKGCGAR